jgi:hypothetical protein
MECFLDGIWNIIRNCRIINGYISFEKERMKPQGCLGIYFCAEFMHKE